jgi:hypothetical protein
MEAAFALLATARVDLGPSRITALSGWSSPRGVGRSGPLVFATLTIPF